MHIQRSEVNLRSMVQSAHTYSEKLSLFADLSPAEREELVKASRVREIQKGGQLFRHGDDCTSFFIVASGAVRVHRETPEGKAVTLHIAIVGDTLGDHEVFEHRATYQAGAVAAEDSIVLEYPSRWIMEKIREHSSLALNMLAAISHSSSRMAVDKEHLVTLKTPQRIGCFLLRLCHLHQLNPHNFTLPYTKATIASKLGMEPESFLRALAKLKEVGVTVNGHEVQIASVDALDAYVCNACSVSGDCGTCEQVNHHAGFAMVHKCAK